VKKTDLKSFKTRDGCEEVVNLGPPCRKPGSERKRGTTLSPSDQHLPPEIKQLIEVVMQSLEKGKRHPMLVSSADDYDRFLKWKEIDPSSLICLDEQLRHRVNQHL
jgi:hypothetical protein